MSPLFIEPDCEGGTDQDRSLTAQPFRKRGVGGLSHIRHNEKMPSENAPRLTVAVLNSSEDVLELFRVLLEAEGFNTAAAHVPDIERGDTDVLRFMEQHDPRVVIYDLCPPYQQTWTFAKLLMASDALRNRKIIFTTTNKKQLEKVSGPLDAYEIAEKPYDFQRVVEVVKAAASSL